MWPVIAGAKPIWVPLEPPDFGFDPDRLARAVTPRTRAIVFNSPNNPSGKVFSRAELQAIADLCQKHDLLAITDEIYEHIVYDGLGHTPIATLPGMAERTVTISGLSKTFSVTGWRIGTIVAPEDVSVGIRKVHDFLTVGAPAPLQEAVATAMDDLPHEYYTGMAEAYRRNPDAKIRARYKDEWAVWLKSLKDSFDFANKEQDDFGFYPSEPIMETGAGSIYLGPAAPYPGGVSRHRHRPGHLPRGR
jgi:aminotransferase